MLGMLCPRSVTSLVAVSTIQDFALTELPFEIGKRWDEHPEFHNLHTLKLRHNRLLDIDQGVDKYVGVVR